MQGQQTNIPVRPSVSVSTTMTAPMSSMASLGAFHSALAAPSSVPIFAAAATAVDDDEAKHLQQQQQFDAHAGASWWSPGIESMGATTGSGHIKALGTYAHSSEDFPWQ